MRVAVLGAWHLGCVAAVTMAGWGRQVTVWDRDPRVRAELAAGRPLVDEPGLADALRDHSSRMSFPQEAHPDLAGVDVVLIAYDTPVDDDDRPDLTPIDESIQLVAASAPDGALVLVHSQVPVGTGMAIRTALDAAGRSDLLIAVTPENLRLGRALDDFAHPRALSIGADDPRAAEAARVFWEPAGVEVEVVGSATAELSKHVINTVLATCTALGNELADILSGHVADVAGAVHLARRDSRLASLPLLPGMPFGGGTLARDLGILADRGGEDSLPAAVRRANRQRLRRLADRVARAGGPVCILGLTYKPGTSTLRRSMALELAAAIQGHGLAVRAHDPHADPTDAALAVPGAPRLQTLRKALEGATTLVVATAHREFRAIEPAAIREAGIATIIDLVGGIDTSLDWSGVSLETA
jgi:UDPglucose 6-dehydrogenase